MWVPAHVGILANQTAKSRGEALYGRKAIGSGNSNGTRRKKEGIYITYKIEWARLEVEEETGKRRQPSPG